MKILYLINSFTRAGAEKLVFNLSKRLVKYDVEVVIVALYRNSDNIEREICAALDATHIKTYILDKTVGKDRLRSILKLKTIIRHEKCDLVHAHCSVPMIIGKVAGSISGVPVICTVHSTRGYSPLREKMTRWMCSKYISIGESTERYMLEELEIPSEKVERIYNGVDEDYYSAGQGDPNFWKSKFIYDLPVFISVGRIVQAKNQLCFLKAIKMCHDQGCKVQGVILGSYAEDSSVFIEMVEYIKVNQLEPYIRFLGNCEDVRPFLWNSTAFVMTSIYEGLSVAYLEALFCMTPIITVDLPFVQEIEKITKCAVVVQQNDSEAIATAISQKAFKSISTDGLTSLKEHFSLETMVQKHLELYTSVLHNK